MDVIKILLHPTDVLFFRDGRPIEGSLAGHGAAWPLPNVINTALHAALHRAFPVDDIAPDKHENFGDHFHRVAFGGAIHNERRHCRFGSLTTAGPFPVEKGEEKWYFPRPQDLTDKTLCPKLVPTVSTNGSKSSLPLPLKYPVASRVPPSKDSPANDWLSREAFEQYLEENECSLEGVGNSDIFDAEHSIGIAIDPVKRTAVEKKFYSAQYLRLRDQYCLGQLAAARNDESVLLREMFGNSQPFIVAGGQRRVCTVEQKELEQLPLPMGKTTEFPDHNGKHLVKWVLLSPAIWPRIPAGKARRRESASACREHPGGWLPNWIDSETGEVLLRVVTPDERERRRKLNHNGKGYDTNEGGALRINAHLVAALVPKKAIVVTGWSLGKISTEEEGIRLPGAKSTHLAVPAGAVYYFQSESKDEAEKLAAALNWHGKDKNPSIITNRRSTLMGEKGFGLGVCGGWNSYPELDQQITTR